MSALTNFKSTKEFEKWTDYKKELFNRELINAAHLKDPRKTNLNALDENDIKKIKGKLKDIK